MKRLPRVAVYNRVKDEDGEMTDTENRFLLNELVTSGFARALQNNIYISLLLRTRCIVTEERTVKPMP